MDCVWVRSDTLPFNRASRQATWWQSPPTQTLKSKEMAIWKEACCQPCCLVLLSLPLQPPKTSSAERVRVSCRQWHLAGREQGCCWPCPPEANSHHGSPGRPRCIPKTGGGQSTRLGQAGVARPAVFAASLPPEAAVDERHRRLTFVRLQSLVKHNRPDQRPHQLNSSFPPSLLAFC